MSDTIDRDLCELCDAYGADKRMLTIACGYAVDEAVPEAHRIPREEAEGLPMWAPFRLNLCKSCRARLLAHLGQWRGECVALRGRPKDHDGGLEDIELDRTIPVRINGATQMMNEFEYASYLAAPSSGGETDG